VGSTKKIRKYCIQILNTRTGKDARASGDGFRLPFLNFGTLSRESINRSDPNSQVRSDPLPADAQGRAVIQFRDGAKDCADREMQHYVRRKRFAIPGKSFSFLCRERAERNSRGSLLHLPPSKNQNDS
jgi:hypothetical protein